MKDLYFNYYCLSYFQREKEIRPSQILHVLRGKKTPSMYYLTEVNQWHHGFALEKQMEKEYLMKIVQAAINEKWLVSQNQGFLLTEEGHQTLTDYFTHHYYPQSIQHFMTLDLHAPFWELFQLFTQVFSEWSYQNAQYTAVIKEPRQQERVRQLIQANQGNGKQLLGQWQYEQKKLLESLSTPQANTLANLLTGHQLVGKTRIQLAQHLEMNVYEFRFYLRDILEEVIHILQQQASEFAIFTQLLRQIQTEYFMSMSESTYRTYQLLQAGQDISTIAKKRRLKVNTIKEHLLEIAFVLREFPIEEFVPAKLHQDLMQKFQNNKEYTYRDAVTDFVDLEFYHYRLVELERMRHG